MTTVSVVDRVGVEDFSAAFASVVDFRANFALEKKILASWRGGFNQFLRVSIEWIPSWNESINRLIE